MRDLALCENEALVNGRAYSPVPANTAGQAIALGMLCFIGRKQQRERHRPELYVC